MSLEEVAGDRIIVRNEKRIKAIENMKRSKNLIDKYKINPDKYWDNDAILADLDTKRHDFSVLCCNLGIDFNIATVIRNSNAFLAKMVYIYGRKKYDRRGAVGTYKYIHLEVLPTENDLNKLDNMHWVGIDNTKSAKDINNFNWPKDSLMVFGQEDIGIPDHIMERCKDKIYIGMFGSVRSINVGCASAIAMASYCRQWGKAKNANALIGE
jgi:tRNA G18 (ribose-2'-O)-methylase SpoU